MPQVLVQFLLGSVTMVASMRMTSSTSCRASPPSMSLLRLALPASTVALVALNIAQNGPSQPINLGAILKRDAHPTISAVEYGPHAMPTTLAPSSECTRQH